MPTALKFKDMWERLGCTGDWRHHYGRLVECYMEPHRRYHTMAHVGDVLHELTLYSQENLLERPAESEAVAWWHDAVYRIFYLGAPVKDNEEKSMSMAITALAEGKSPQLPRTRIGMGILATKHQDGHDVMPSMRPVVDADMSIIGQRWERYDRYRTGIEREYRGGPWSEKAYLQGRMTLFLEPMLKRDRLFHTDWFRRRYEARARENMQRELGYLRYRLERL